MPLRLAKLLVALAVLVVLVRCAWVCDDAYITFRVIDNAWNGHGLRWNVDERVWVYTHPLWMLLLLAVHPLLGEPYLTAILLGLALSLGAIAALLAGARAPAVAALAALLLGGKAFADYATSGLEAPLAYALLAAVGLAAARVPADSDRAALGAGLAVALGVLIRPDYAVLLAPLVAYVLYRAPTARRLGLIVLGAAPLLAWEAFAVVYYGVLVPNPATAKLAPAGPTLMRLARGADYFLVSARHDPLLLPALIAAAWAPRGAPRALAVGIAAYAAYLVAIGGDFMSGRLLAPPFVLALALLRPRLDGLGGRAVAAIVAAAAIATAINPRAPVRTGTDFGAGERPPPMGVVDEREEYFATTGFFTDAGFRRSPPHPFRFQGEALRKAGPQVRSVGYVGMVGYYAGPDVVLVDLMALTDPFLARLPPRRDELQRVGHLKRFVPPGYLRARETGDAAAIEDPQAAALYAAVRAATSAPLASPKRWDAIVGLHTGRFAVDEARYAWPRGQRRHGPPRGPGARPGPPPAPR